MNELRLRVWDLPTRIFHWALAALVVAAIVTARIGGNAMDWHFRVGYAIFTLLAFRLVWGFVGGHWSRFRSFAWSPAATWRYLRGQSLPHEHHGVGHNPLGAWSVFALLAVLVVQVATGLVADDEIASRGPLSAHVASATVALASHWHRGWGQWLVIGLALAHVCAIAAYLVGAGRNLIGPMLHGDQVGVAGAPAAADDVRSRAIALAIVAACGLVAWAIASLGD